MLRTQTQNSFTVRITDEPASPQLYCTAEHFQPENTLQLLLYLCFKYQPLNLLLQVTYIS